MDVQWHDDSSPLGQSSLAFGIYRTSILRVWLRSGGAVRMPASDLNQRSRAWVLPAFPSFPLMACLLKCLCESLVARQSGRFGMEPEIKTNPFNLDWYCSWELPPRRYRASGLVGSPPVQCLLNPDLTEAVLLLRESRSTRFDINAVSNNLRLPKLTRTAGKHSLRGQRYF
jgi:hypothetical protein